VDAFFSAAKQGRADDLYELIEGKQVDIATVDVLSNNALHYSAAANHSDCVELLVKAHIPLNQLNNVGDTPLHKAAARGSLAAITILVEAGANIDAKNKNGERPYDIAKNDQVRELLAPQIPDLDDPDEGEDEEALSDEDN